jgi:short-subunit dehydrogenase
MNWQGKCVWITGASSGIGRAAATEWAKLGAHVILSSRRRDALEEVVRDWHPTDKQRSLILPLDLSQSETLPEIAKNAIKWKGQIDVLVHCGGISQRSLAIETAVEVDRRVMEIDYFGTLTLTKAILPEFVKRKAGHFVVVTSLMGLFSSPLRSGYCAAKHALHGFFESLRAEHHKDNIHITMVCPGFIKTSISLNAMIGDGSKQGSMDKKTGAGITAEECAKQIIRAVNRNKHQVLIGRSEIIAAYLARFFPRLLRIIVRKTAVR